MPPWPFTQNFDRTPYAGECLRHRRPTSELPEVPGAAGGPQPATRLAAPPRREP